MSGMERTVRGRPGRVLREAFAWRRLSRSRCRRRTVSGQDGVWADEQVQAV